MAINKVNTITDETLEKIKKKSVLYLPDRPSEKGITAQQMKQLFTDLVVGSNLSTISEIKRIVTEINNIINQIELADIEVKEELQLELSSAVDELNLAISGLESDLLSHKNNTTNAHGINTLIASLNSLLDNLQAHANNTDAHALDLVKADILALKSILNSTTQNDLIDLGMFIGGMGLNTNVGQQVDTLVNRHNTDEEAHSELFSAIKSRLASIENIIGTIDGEEDANDVIDKLHEIVNLLNGYAEGTTLAELLSQYADVNHDHDEAYVQKEEGKGLFSGSYNDLTNKPNIPSKTSDLTNDSGFVTEEDLPTVQPQTIINLGEFETREEGLAECLETGLYYFKENNLGYLIHVHKNDYHIEQWWMRVAGGSNVLIFSRGSNDYGSTWTDYPNFMLHDKAPVSWFTNVSYSMFDLVAYEGKVYFSLTNSNSSNIPSVTLGVHWDEVDYKNVQPDWNQSDNTKDDYIKNKPTIPTKVSQLENDSGFITEEDLPPEYDDSELRGKIDNINDTKIPSLIKNIQLLSNGVFRVTKYDNTYFDIDTKLEKVVTNFTYNATTKNLELSLDDSTVLTIPMSAFIDDYSGSEGTQFVVNVSSENVISVTMKDGTVTYNQLAQAVKDKLDNIYTLPQATETTLGGVKVRVISDYPEYYSGVAMEPVAIDPTTGKLHVKKWMLPTDYYNKSETENIINNAILGLLGGES